MPDPIRLNIDSAARVDGREDTTQLEVQGHTTQTQPLQTWQDAGGDALAQVTGDGRLQVGDLDLGTPAALVEANAALTLPSSRPKRGWQALGRLTGAIGEAVAWAVHELELLGSGGVSGLHAALRARLTQGNTGDASTAELRAGDFETINQGGSSSTLVGQATGVRGEASNAQNAYLAKAVGVEGTVSNDTGGDVAEAAAFEVAPPVNAGTIDTLYGLRIPNLTQGGQNYAIHTGQGPVRLGDFVEMPARATPANPPQDNLRLYPKSDGHLYIKDWNGVESDLTGGGLGVSENGASVVQAADALDFRDFNVEDAGGNDVHIYHNLPHLCNGRLTLVSGVPVPTSDVSYQHTVYFTPYRGNRISLYDGTRWRVHTFTELSIKVMDTQIGTLTSGSAVVTGLTNTSQFVVGMDVGGTGVPVATAIVSIDGPTQVTLTQNATATGTQALVFTMPEGKNLDVFCLSIDGMPALRFGPLWTNDSTRAVELTLQEDVYTKAGDPTWRYLGTIHVKVGGTCADGAQWRHVYNAYNQCPRKLKRTLAGLTWYYNNSAFRPLYNSTGYRVEAMVGLPDVYVCLEAHCGFMGLTGPASGAIGIDLDGTTGNDADFTLRPTVANTSEIVFLYSKYENYLPVGYYYLQLTESGYASGSAFFRSDSYQAGCVGHILI